MMRDAVVVALLSQLSQLSQQRAACLGGYGCAARLTAVVCVSQAYTGTRNAHRDGVEGEQATLLSLLACGVGTRKKQYRS